jgi:hydroxymethylbilane synthase
LWQANHIAERLGTRGHDVSLEIIHTTGDKITDVALAKVASKGIFTKEIEEALAKGSIDLAVHSLKDLPTELAEAFAIAAIPPREDSRDAFCSRKWDSILDLPRGARVGTSSLRREAQLKAVRPDLAVHPLRGNVDTRLRKLESGEYDAVILASAGLRRLARIEFVRELLPLEVMCPAAGQGALAIETRAADDATRNALVFLDDPAARAETECERALLKTLGGGCQVPIGASAKLRDGTLALHGVVAAPDGSLVLRKSGTGTDPAELGISVANDLLNSGGAEILEAVYGKNAAAPQQP